MSRMDSPRIAILGAGPIGLEAALYARFASREGDPPAMKVVAALRQQFGGHPVTAAEDSSG